MLRRGVAILPVSLALLRHTGDMYTDEAACLRAIRAKEARFDGVFFTRVTSTGYLLPPVLSRPHGPPPPGVASLAQLRHLVPAGSHAVNTVPGRTGCTLEEQ